MKSATEALWTALDVVDHLFEADQRATFRSFVILLFFLKSKQPITAVDIEKECHASMPSVVGVLKNLRLVHRLVTRDDSVKPPLYSLTEQGEELRKAFEEALGGGAKNATKKRSVAV